jgi:hypothetical protein
MQRQRRARAETYEQIKRADTENRDSEQIQRAIRESIIRHIENIQRADTEQLLRAYTKSIYREQILKEQRQTWHIKGVQRNRKSRKRQQRQRKSGDSEN